LQVLFQPPLNDMGEFVRAFEYDRAFAFSVESEDGIATKFLHYLTQLAASCCGKQVAMESLAGERACDGAIGTQYPKIETKLFGDRQSESMTASCAQNDFDTFLVSASNGSQISFGNNEFRIQDGAVDIDGQKPDRRGRHKQF
jgi:hypothetical protein